jgi:hypothetical protein
MELALHADFEHLQDVQGGARHAANFRKDHDVACGGRRGEQLANGAFTPRDTTRERIFNKPDTAQAMGIRVFENAVTLIGDVLPIS